MEKKNKKVEHQEEVNSKGRRKKRRRRRRIENEIEEEVSFFEGHITELDSDSMIIFSFDPENS